MPDQHTRALVPDVRGRGMSRQEVLVGHSVPLSLHRPAVASDSTPDLYRRTGCLVHTAYLLAMLPWWRDSDPTTVGAGC